MAVIVAAHAGFCTGVEKAVSGAQAAAKRSGEKGLPARTLGELIHNPLVVSSLAQQGIIAVDSPEQAQGSLLILRSHGVSPQVEQRARECAAEVVDCTCPFVTHLHEQVSAYSRDGAPIILMGDPEHPEVIGTKGWCKGEVFIISHEDEADRLPQSAGDALVVAQTTLSPEQWDRLSDRLKARFPRIKLKRTICRATALRQEDARSLARTVDVMVVVGGGKSANTRKLFETCQKECAETYLVECAADIPPHLINRPELRIGVTAGASTPDWSLKEVVDTMNDVERKDQTMAPDIREAAAELAEQAQPQAAEAAPAAPAQETAPLTDALPQTPDTPAADTPAEEAAMPAPVKEKAPEPKVHATFMDEVAANMTRIRTGQTISGKVVQITDDEICVNIGYKSDGLMKRSDLIDQDIELGDDIDVEVVKVNDGEGNVIVSQRNMVNRKTWDALVAKYEAGEFVDAVGKEAVKGGLLANIDGVRAFIPASHLSQRYVEKISQFVGQPMKLKIIEVDASKKRVVASRKDVMAQENAMKKEAVWGNLIEGSIVKGIVRRFASFGAFVDIGGVDGLIHITDLSWNRSVQPQDVLKVNEEVEVKILSVDRERERIQLGYKQLQPRPWDNIEEKYPVGTVLSRKVVRVRPFGAFIELEPGVDGLVHISQVSLTRINKVEDVLTPGQDVNVKVLAVDTEAKRISLSIREALEEGAYDYSAEIPGEDHGHHAAAPVLQTMEEAVNAPESADDTGVAAAFKRAAKSAEEAAPAAEETAEAAAEAAEEAAEEAVKE